jgi:hypothetical protein
MRGDDERKDHSGLCGEKGWSSLIVHWRCQRKFHEWTKPNLQVDLKSFVVEICCFIRSTHELHELTIAKLLVYRISSPSGNQFF